MSLSKIQLLQLLVGHWEMAYALGEMGSMLADADTDTMTERWEVVKKAGDIIAPGLDDIIAKVKSQGVQAQGLMQTEKELEDEIISSVQTAFLQANAPPAGMVIAAGETEQLSAQALRFNGERLSKAVDLFGKVLPILLQLAPMLIK